MTRASRIRKEFFKKSNGDGHSTDSTNILALTPPRGDRKKEETMAIFPVEGGKEITTTLVPVNELQIDERYQFHPEKEDGRISALNRWLMKHGGYSPALAGAIHVSRRKDGSMYVVDGYGRVWMGTKMASDPITHIPAVIHTNLRTWKDEAQLFIELNRHKRTIKAPHLFVVAAHAGHEPEATILEMVLEAGYAVERLTHKKGRVLAPSSLIFAYTLGKEVLRLTLFDLRHTWGDQKGVDGRHLVALSAVRASNPHVDRERLRKILDPKSWPAKDASSQARAEAQVIITTRSPQSRDTNPYLARAIIKRYNHGLGKKKGTKGLKRLDPRALDALESRFSDEALHKDVWDFRV